MTGRERSDFAALIRQRERVLKTKAKERSKELMAQFEQQIAAVYDYDDDAIWEEAAKVSRHLEHGQVTGAGGASPPYSRVQSLWLNPSSPPRPQAVARRFNPQHSTSAKSRLASDHAAAANVRTRVPFLPSAIFRPPRITVRECC
jgi:hypothetical protein